MNPSDTDIAWLAGLLEGEGCFTIDTRQRDGGGSRPTMSVALRMTDLDVVERAHTVAGLSVSICSLDNSKRLRGDSDPRRDVARWSTAYYWAVRGYEAERVMRLVRPYMGQRRGAKIDEILAAPDGTYSHQPRIKEAT